MVNRRRGNKQGEKGAVIDLEVVSSRLINIDQGLTIDRCVNTHWQVKHWSRVLLDLWPTTGKFRVHDAPQGSPAVTGSAEDVLTVVEWLLSKRSD